MSGIRDWWSNQSTGMKVLVAFLAIGVIGIGLVVLTIIAAAIIGTFVLGMPAEDPGVSEAPQINMEYSHNKTAETLSMTHAGGDSVSAENLRVKVGDGERKPWPTSGQVIAGDTATVENVPPGVTVQVIWVSESGSTEVIGEYEIPE